jgi:RNA polymerase sigma-54 factor
MAKIEKNSSKDVHSYISEQQQSAGWLIRNIEQRSRTILRVATEIVRYQDSFFVSGIKGLNPLKLKIIADAVGMHESTVSRAKERSLPHWQQIALSFAESTPKNTPYHRPKN